MKSGGESFIAVNGLRKIRRWRNPNPSSVEESRITSGSNDNSEVKLESLESFPIKTRTKGLRRVFSARDLAF